MNDFMKDMFGGGGRGGNFEDLLKSEFFSEMGDMDEDEMEVI